MDDGNFTGSGLKLNTNAFKIEDVHILIKALEEKFSLNASINKTSIDNQFTIYIPKKDLPLLINLVKDYMHPTMLYKLNII